MAVGIRGLGICWERGAGMLGGIFCHPDDLLSLLGGDTCDGIPNAIMSTASRSTPFRFPKSDEGGGPRLVSTCDLGS